MASQLHGLFICAAILFVVCQKVEARHGDTRNSNYYCYRWSEGDLTAMGSFGYWPERRQCNSYPGYVFTWGDNIEYPNCGDCVCCQPSPNEKYTCHTWNADDHRSMQTDTDTETCQTYMGYVFTEGINGNYPNCNGCWCCKAASNVNYVCHTWTPSDEEQIGNRRDISTIEKEVCQGHQGYAYEEHAGYAYIPRNDRNYPNCQDCRCCKPGPDINECDSSPCQNGATCTNRINFYTCTCAPGWIGYNCQQDIDECDSNPCQNGATCNNLLNGYTCTCPPGYQGTNCEESIPCMSNPCQNGGSCSNLQSPYLCTCTSGWTGVNCEQDIDECGSNPCRNGATCLNSQNHYTCVCAGGWRGVNCEIDIDECGSNPCRNGATCLNNQNHYTCVCAGGWRGVNCEIDIDECASNPCQNGATCLNNENHYICQCAGGWQGVNCEIDIDECASNPCQNGATCLNNENHYICQCAGGWQGVNCEIDIDECASNPCQNGATCLNNQNHYTCVCAGGWRGVDCEIDIDECASIPCYNGGTCNNLINLYTCFCPVGWTSYDCEVADVQFVCSPNDTIEVIYLPPHARCYAMQNITSGTDIQCNITVVDERTVRLTGCSKDLPILLSYGEYTFMERYQVHAGDSLTVVTIMCSEIPDVGVGHSINSSLSARLEVNEEANLDPTYVISSSLNMTSTVVGDRVAWTISYPVEYILEVNKCSAFPGWSDSSDLFIPLISSGGCTMDDMLISDFIDNMNGTATAVLKAFKFYAVESVYLQCNANVCPGDTEECNTACSRQEVDIKKRSDDEGSHGYKSSVQNILHVVDASSSATTITIPALFGLPVVWNVLQAVIKLHGLGNDWLF